MNSITKKLIRDYMYQLESLEDVKDISKDAEGDFRSAMVKHNETALEALVPKDSDQVQKKIDDVEPVRFEDKLFKKLFRKLAVKCHPDKLDNSSSERELAFLKKCYEDMNTANETYDWGLLLKVSIELEVEFEGLLPEHLDNINKNIESIKKKINAYESSMAYQWYTQSDPTAKKGYLESCAAIFMSKLESDK